MPAKYVMDYTVEGEALAPGQLRTVTITYGPDTATIVLLGDTAATRRFAMHGAVPVLGRSVVGFEIALGRFRAAHADTATIVIESPTGPQFGAVKMPVRMAGPDSILIAGVVYAQLAQDGRLLQMVAGPAQTRRVDPYDMNKLIAEFTAVETPKRAAALAAAASRVEITLPAEVLDRLAGTDALNATASMIVKRDGDKFLAQVAPQPALQLFAQSPTTFFLKGVDVQIEFEVDASGNGTALTIIQNGARQRAVRAKQ